MEKFMKIPLFIPLVGIIISFILIIIGANMPDMSSLLIIGMIPLHLFGWILAVKFFLSGIGFFSSVLAKK